MRTYKAQDWFSIKDRGQVVAVINDEDFKRYSGHMIGEIIEIDRKRYRVKGVENFAVDGEPIGLLVEEVEP